MDSSISTTNHWAPRGVATGFIPLNRCLITLLIGISCAVVAQGGQYSAYPAVVNLDALDGSDGFVITTSASIWQSADMASKARDFNGDGIADLLLSDTYNSPNNWGRAYVIFGGSDIGSSGRVVATSLAPDAGLVLAGGEDFWIGESVSDVGDINNDGMVDIVVSGRQRGRPDDTVLYVVFGGGDHPSGVLEVTSLDGIRGAVVTLVGSRGNRVLAPVGAAGDINADGIDDFLVGGSQPAGSLVIFGQEGFGAGGTLSAAVLNGANGYAVDLMPPSSHFSFSMKGAGDVNADGIDDFVVGGADDLIAGQLNQGYGYVIFGGQGTGASGSLDLATLDGKNGFVVKSSNDTFRLGRSVDAAGDLNGDGIGDIILGAPGDAGETFVLYGAAGIGSNGLIDVDSIDGHNGFRVKGTFEGENSGITVSGAGDVNGDGLDDVIIGTYGTERSVLPWEPSFPRDPNRPFLYSFSSYVVFGSDEPVQGGVIELEELDGSQGFRLESQTQITGSTIFRGGQTVEGVGDINADGIDDILIRQYTNTEGPGATYVVFGRIAVPEPASGFLALLVSFGAACGTMRRRGYPD